MPLFGPPNVERLASRGDVTGLTEALVYPKDARVRAAAAHELGESKSPQALAPLIAALRDEDPHVRRTAAEALASVRDPRAIQPIVALLRDQNASVRGSAIKALAEFGGASVEPLVGCLRDRDVEVRQTAIRTLGQIADVRGVGPLIQALKDNHRRVRADAADALVKIGAGAVEPLIATLMDEDHELRQRAAEILERLAWQPDGSDAGASYWIAKGEWDRCAEIGAPAIAPLLATLEDDSSSRALVAETLEKLHWQPNGSEAGAYYWIAKRNWAKCVESGMLAVNPLIDALQDDNADVRQAAAQALGEIADARAVRPLIAALKDGYSKVRASASEALAKIGSPAIEPLVEAIKEDAQLVRQTTGILEKLRWQPDRSEAGVRYWIAKREWSQCVEIGAPAVEPLVAVLGDADPEVREAAASALGQIGDARAVVALIAALKDTEWEVRCSAALALGEIGDVRAVEPLISALEDPHARVREGITEALVQIGAPAVDSIVAALQGEAEVTRAAAAEALGRIGDERAVEPLITALEDREWDVRKAAITALGKVADPRAVEPLVTAVRKGTAGDLEARIFEALSELGKPAVEPLIVALLVDAERVRVAAADALGNIGDEQAVKPLMAALEDERVAVRITTARALGKIGDTRAVEPLIATLRDEDPEVRASAAEALASIGDLKGIAPLITALRDENGSVRGAAAEALGILGDARAVEPLIAALEDEAPAVREKVALALGAVGDDRAIKVLVRALPEEGSAPAVATALERLGWKPDGGEVEVAYWIAKGEWDKCVELGDTAIEPLVALLSHGREDVRQRAAETLSKLGIEAVPRKFRRLDPTGDPYIDACFQFPFEECLEPREWPSMAKAVAIVDATSPDGRLRLASELQRDQPDFWFSYYQLAANYRLKGRFDEALKALDEGLRLSKSKYHLCEIKADTEWIMDHFEEAVTWWLRSAVIQAGTGELTNHNPFLYLSYIAEAFGDGRAAATLRACSDRIRAGKLRLVAEEANKVYLATGSSGTESMRQAIHLLVSEYLSSLSGS